MTPEDERYFAALEDKLEAGIAVAERAREAGADPTDGVEIPVARDMADRVENILGIEGVAERVRELEGETSREEAALTLAEDFAEGRVGDYETTAGAIEGAVRTAVALLTEGVVAAPIEGVDRVDVERNDDGTEFVRVLYAGPIRSAGGTAQALSVLVADYARTLLGVDEYRPRPEEVERYAEEVSLYDDETGLQYSPADEETRFIAENCPVMLDGEATGDAEVSGYRDLERVHTDNPRGGMCLVLAEGIALKAPKIKRYTDDLEAVDWPWLDDLIEGTYRGADAPSDQAPDETPAPEGDGVEATDDDGNAAGSDPAVDGPPRVEPSEKYLRDLIAGRPVFAHPSEPGGFRLRYGRARNHGFATAGVHPATMRIVDDFLATGTQLKTQFPGKAAGVVPVDSIEGPTVRLANGDVRRIDDPAEAEALRNGVEAVLDLGEYLVNYGEFVENNHDLAPAAYAVEWWREDLAAAGVDVQALADDPDVDLAEPSPAAAVAWARDHDAPLHPAYTYLWHDVGVGEFETLADAVAAGAVVDGELRVENAPPVRAALEALLVEHRQREEWVYVPTWRPLALSLGLDADALADRSPRSDAGDGATRGGTDDGGGEQVDGDDRDGTSAGADDGIASDGGRAAVGSVDGPPPADVKTWSSLSAEAREWPNAVEAVREVAPFDVRERAPTRVGARMGRPEKSEKRELNPAVHTLFPIGAAGGDQRDVVAATEDGDGDDRGRVHVAVGRRTCEDCGAATYRTRCPDCDGRTTPDYRCPDCGQAVEPAGSGRVECPRCGVEATSVEPRPVDVRARLREALDAVGERENAFDILKGVKGLTSRTKTPEPLEKGVLRAKHGVSAFKDGTVRYDITDLPVTAVRPEEVAATAEQFRALGYGTDVHGEPLRHDDQLVELKVQDVVVSEGCADHLLRTADFVDDLLTSYYGMAPYYEVDERDDLVGKLVFGLAPHTSAAVVGRVVGFTSASVGYAHPYFHAAKRRNCDGDEDCVMLLMDGLLNFSKSYLPDKRGGSVAEDSRLVAVSPDGDVRFVTFSELWDNLDSDVVHDGKFRKKACLSEGWKTYAFDDQHRASLQPVEKAIRYPAGDAETLLRVETQFGRSLDITADHSLFRYDDGIEEVAGEDLREGDLVLAPRKLDVEPVETTVDVAEAVAEPYVFIDDHVEDLLETVWESTDRGSPAHQQFMRGLSYRLAKNKIGYNRFERILDAGGFGGVPKDVTIGLAGSERGVNREIEVDEEFGWLLGLFVAEGSLSGDSPTIHNSDESIVERAADVVETTLGHDPSVRWSNRAYETRLPAVFEEVLYELGFVDASPYDSSEKLIPDSILRAPREVVLSFLRGFVAGGGSDESDDNVTTVAFHTTSEDVRDGIVFLLHRLGIVADVSTLTDREGNRQDRYTVTVSGGANDNPLHRILDGNEPYCPKSLVVSIPDALMDVREMDIDGVKQLIPKYLERRENVSLEKLREMVGVLETEDLPDEASERLADIRPLVDGDLSYLRVKNVEEVDYDGFLYDLQVGGEPVFTANWLYAHNSMDAPLVMSSRVDPAEIDDEPHHVDTVSGYSREFYEATREMADPATVDVELAGDSVGTDDEYRGFDHTHDTGDVAGGPALSAYKTLGSMTEKMDAQLELARKLRGVDEVDVAERVIEYHFLPDLIGNLRAFTRQETRCLDCGAKYRRMPLSGNCRECGGDVNLTVHEGSVTKYMETARTVAEEYGAREYTKQRLEILEKSLDSLFENDKNRRSTLGEFM